ncbi:hypothetical protein BDFB_002332 [Asbolus verrucosus]|uniref:Uncharacterized protein n=1 Tax=Asbolus verrucosus TaxID=1661398 RepID=A0A482W5K7_ASBVE|nr:hypothetical protein BDFB_002332 [Asbolus verrucosus]
MDPLGLAPPPLPPKTRRSPPEPSATVLNSDVFAYPEVNGAQSQSHVVKIRINPEENVICDVAPCIRISVNNPDMIQTTAMADASSERSTAYFFYNCAVMSSGQVSPSDTLDSGTCSDLDGTPPPLPKKKSSSGVSVTLIQHKRASSLASSADSDDNDSNISCDSLTSGKTSPHNSALPPTLLQDIRERNKLSAESTIVKSYEERKEEEKTISAANSLPYDTDMFYKFHLNEHLSEDDPPPSKVVEDETFAGYKDLLGDGASTIRSAKGTVRGVKNRVRAGIATFLQINSVAKVRLVQININCCAIHKSVFVVP